MAERGRMEPRRLLIALALVAPVTIIFSFWAYLHFGFQIGMGTARTHPWQMMVVNGVNSNFVDAISQPTGMNRGMTGAIGFGMVLTWLLLFLKLRFTWWPLHPIAYPTSDCNAMHFYTVVMLIVWITKLLLIRYGGLRAYRRALLFFLGLIVGQFSAQILRTGIFLLLNIGR